MKSGAAENVERRQHKQGCPWLDWLIGTKGRRPDCTCAARSVKCDEDVTVRIDGKPFCCECGCNVFRHLDGDPNRYHCNSCGEVYEGK